ncbi:DUF3152 domain-containing protein [Streptomyces fulvoviolaceus]|uniref:DUF3152 domain-containing protein n=1 Tax=Streptomyces fulvoviolaceus TaxID=285535 RepID=UPI000996A4E1|nr:DUF3152 domain-containing protein [Streptomyces fulvoviolaceus]
MGRHSRRGPAPKSGAGKGGSKGASKGADEDAAGRGRAPVPPPAARQAAPGRGMPGYGAPGQGAPRFPDGTPARGVPRMADGTPAHGFPRLPDGTPARGFPRLPDGTPAHGFPRLPDGTPARGVPQARGGHPQQREPGGGWGELSGQGGTGYGRPAGPGATLPGQRQAPPGGPRQEYLDAFGADGLVDDDVFAPRTPAPGRRTAASAHAAEPYGSVTDWPSETDTEDDEAPPAGEPEPAKGAKGRTFTGIAAAAVTTVLAVVVAGQVTDGHDDTALRTQTATDQARDVRDAASPSASPSASVATLTYEQKMDKKYALGAKLDGSGKFDAIQGIDKAPGKGQKYTYRVDVEQGLGLDGELFAEAVQKTLNDDRSWAHDGARTFERIYSGKPDFVITLASPGTTADWCAKSGLDTTVDNVSCDSAATERVMINAYRWAQGSSTYGDRIHAYRQMLINHEVGHRLGYHHVTCDKDGELAPVMQQQTKFLNHNGIHCKANPWPYPGS